MAFDEFTEDNLPNRLFKATVERLSRRASLSETQRLLAQLRAVFTDVADCVPHRDDFAAAERWQHSR